MTKKSFRDQFTSAQLRAMQKAAGEVKQRLYGFVSAVVDDTPVKDGGLRGSWQIQKSPDLIQDNLPEDPSGAATKQRLFTKIRYLPIHQDWDIYFGNGKPYAQKIEYEGYSKQAPNGMLRKNIARGGQAFSGFKLGSFDK